MEQQTLPNIPEIILPERWNDPNYKELQCEICHWSGNPQKLFELPRDFKPTFREASSMDNCTSCRILALVITQVLNLREGEIRPGQDDRVHVSSRDNWPQYLDIWFENGPYMGDVVLFTPEEYDRYGVPCGIPQMSTVQHMNTSSEASLSWAKDQIESHQGCCQPTNTDSPSFIPTRLIDVSEPTRDVFLNENVPGGSPYVALSYCWGKDQTCQTTNDTLVRYRQGISWAALPKTIQHAVEVTRRLDIKYLWVDRLCIIQKNEEDWKRESGRMIDVYRHSYVTIAGAWGPGSDSGLFHTPAQDFRPILLANLRLNDRCWPLYMRRHHHHYFEWTSSHGPLFTRAWTYQERLISARVLYFRENELSFECFCSADCQCGLTRHQFSENKRHSWSLDRGSRLLFYEDVVKPGDYHPSGLWRSMVYNYSRFKLTNPCDRLPVIGAMAQQFQKNLLGEQYLAGLWSGSLPTDLLWYNLGPTNGISTIVPTWSWASTFEGTPHWSRALSNDGLASTIEVVRANCQYGVHNPFGLLESSQLIVRGWLLKCWASKKDNFDHIIFHSWTRTARTRSKRKVMSERMRKPKRKLTFKPSTISARAAIASHETIDNHAWLSVPGRKRPPTVYLLEIARNDAEDEDAHFSYNCIYFLVLRRKNREYDETRRVFSRVGAFCVDSHFGYEGQDARNMKAVLKTFGNIETVALT